MLYLFGKKKRGDEMGNKKITENKKRLFLDIFLIFLTNGIWLIWMFIRYLRNEVLYIRVFNKDNKIKIKDLGETGKIIANELEGTLGEDKVCMMVITPRKW